MDIIWTEYMKYRINLRGFDFNRVEEIIKHSAERYYDMTTHRSVAVGRHDDRLVLIPYECEEELATPVTIHVTTRQQINFRLRTGRFQNE